MIFAFDSKIELPFTPKITFVQVAPPLVVFQTPLPFTSPETYDSPVPRYQTLLLLGSIAIHDTAKFSGTPTCVHSERALDIFVFFQSPPLTPPANTVSLEASLGSKITALVLPPTLFGPLSIQGLFKSSPGTFLKTLSKFNFFWSSNNSNLLVFILLRYSHLFFYKSSFMPFDI